MAPSRHDWKIVDWDVKPQHNQPTYFFSDVYRSVNYIGSLAKFTWTLRGSFTLHATQCSLHFDKPQNNEIHSFNNEPIKEVTSDKHLGIFLSSDGTWHEHINYITAKAWIRINVMRNLKFLLDRRSLVEIIYISFIRPRLEYADVFWNNCMRYEVNALEKIQLEAARIVTGATKLFSLEVLYIETGWESVETRRSKHKMCLFYKMNNSISSNYLSSLVPQSVETTTHYSLHDATSIRQPLTDTIVLDYGTIFRLKWENQIRTQILNIKLIRLYGDITWLVTDSLKYNIYVSELLAVPWIQFPEPSSVF